MYAAINVSSSGSNPVVAAPNSTTRIRVTGYTLVAAGSVTAQWASAANNLSGAMSLVTGYPISPPPLPWVGANPSKPGLLECNPGEALNLILGSGVQVSGHLTYDLVGV